MNRIKFFFSLLWVVTADPCSGPNEEEDNVAAILGSSEFKGCTFRIERGDYSGILSKVVENLEKAKVCITAKKS